uniref:malate dehydrogenase, cytoplasmic-like isoform X4 n=1 Tax=Pristiophorus japonicus TaxID=55135 RepID=UPI00398EF3F3
MADPVKVLVTGAAGQIAYSLLYSIANGEVFGEEQPLALILMDVPSMLGALDGVAMELQDCTFDLLQEVMVTDREEVAFRNVDVAVLIGAVPRQEGLEKSGLLQANVRIFRSQGQALNAYAKKTVKLALKLGTDPGAVRNVIIWGDHSSTQYPDTLHATVTCGSRRVRLRQALGDDSWLAGDFMAAVQQRGASVIRARKLSPAMSAANAVCDHLRALWFGTQEGEWLSMGVLSDGNSYGVPEHLIYSFPVTIQNGRWQIVRGLSVSDFSRQRMALSARELLAERERALGMLAKSNL